MFFFVSSVIVYSADNRLLPDIIKTFPVADILVIQQNYSKIDYNNLMAHGNWSRKIDTEICNNLELLRNGRPRRTNNYSFAIKL